MKKLKRETNGITLVALVITIIILLILAGIAIASLTGDNGLFARAKQAREETLTAQEDELRRLTMLEAAANLENHPYTDKNGDTATIPAGFAVSQVEGENTIEDGLVIIDSNGNEFVWIPVKLEEGETFESKYPRTAFSSNNTPSLGLNTVYTEPYLNGYNGEDIEYQTMLENVTKYKGFYVGRYEAGCAIPREDSNKTTEQIVLVKKGVNVYNYVPWGETMDSTNSYNGITGAVELSKKFSTVNNYDASKLTTTLIYGIQWDMMLRYVADEEHNVNDAKTWGNYNNSTGLAITNSGVSNMNFKTGRNEAWKAKNIYDIAGNVNEWTMESFNTYGRVLRGGHYSTESSTYPPSGRGYSNPYDSDKVAGFRLALYIK